MHTNVLFYRKYAGIPDKLSSLQKNKGAKAADKRHLYQTCLQIHIVLWDYITKIESVCLAVVKVSRILKKLISSVNETLFSLQKSSGSKKCFDEYYAGD